MISELYMLVLIFSISILFGFLLLRLFRWQLNLLQSFIWGTAGLIAVFHILAYPLFMLKSSFTLLFFVYLFTMLLILGLAAISFIRNKDYKIIYKDIQAGLTFVTNKPFISVIVLLLITALIYTCIFCYHPTVDDGYYLARSMEVLANNTLDIHASQSWYGEVINNYSDLTDASTLAFFVAFNSKLFRLSPTIFCRRCFALLMILAHLSSLFSIWDIVMKKGKNGTEQKQLFLILYILLQLLAEKVCSPGHWLTFYIWQGKAVLISLIFPLMLIACSRIIQNIHNNSHNNYEWLSVFIVLTAGISVSTVGLFLPLILFFSYGIAFLITSKFRYFKAVILPAFLVTLPVIICGIVSYINIATVNTGYFEIGKSAEWSWIQQFLRANDIFQISLFIVGFFFFIFKGSDIERTVFCISPLILFLTFLNPFFSKLVSNYVTTAEVYWRLFWLLPVYITSSAFLTKTADILFNGKLQNGLAAISIVFILLIAYQSSTYYAFSPTLASDCVKNSLKISAPKRNNSLGVSEEIYDMVNAVLEDWDGEGRPRLLTKYDINFEIRQCSCEIITYWAGQSLPVPELKISQGELVREYDQITDAQFLHKALKTIRADYICLKNSDLLTSPDSNLFSCLINAGDYSLWKVL